MPRGVPPYRTIRERNELRDRVAQEFLEGTPKSRLTKCYSISRDTLHKFLEEAGIPKEKYRHPIPEQLKPHMISIKRKQQKLQQKEKSLTDNKVINTDNKVINQSENNNFVDPKTVSNNINTKGGWHMERDLQREIEREVELARLKILDEVRKEINNSLKTYSQDKESILDKVQGLALKLKQTEDLSSNAKNTVDELSKAIESVRQNIPKVPEIPEDIIKTLPDIKKKVDELPEDLCKQWPMVCQIIRQKSHQPTEEHTTIQDVIDCPECDGYTWVLNNLDYFTKDEKAQQAIAQALRKAGWTALKKVEKETDEETEEEEQPQPRKRTQAKKEDKTSYRV